MKVLVASVDSDIGSQIAAVHIARGDEVHATSRNGKTKLNMELSHPFRWPKFPHKYDRMYYTIAIGDHRASRAEVMQVNCFASYDFLKFASQSMEPTGHMVVLSSEWGSINRCDSTRAGWYRMSKAGLNMGVKILSILYPSLKWTLMQPGLVNTKLTTALQDLGTALTPLESATGVVNTADRTSLQFSFVDYKGATIEF